MVSQHESRRGVLRIGFAVLLQLAQLGGVVVGVSIKTAHGRPVHPRSRREQRVECNRCVAVVAQCKEAQGANLVDHGISTVLGQRTVERT